MGGLKLKRRENTRNVFTPLDRNQAITCVALLVVILGILLFEQDIALLAITVAVILMLLGQGDEQKIVSAIPWYTLLRICGMTVLINVVIQAGGINLLSNALSNLITEKTAQPVMIILSGVMNIFSSASGVVMPTLIPTAGILASEMDISLLSLITGVVIGANSMVISPLSIVGSFCLSSAPEGVDKDKLFRQLFLCAISIVLLGAVLSIIGMV